MSLSSAGERGRRRFGLLSATLSVAVTAGILLLVGVYWFGSGADGVRGRAGIGAPAEVLFNAHAAPERPDPDGSDRADRGEPRTANQPAAPTSAAPSPSRPGPSATKTTSAPRTVATVTTNGGMESQVLALVNAERAAAGCTALTADDRLTAAARGHSSDMAARNYFSHDTPEGVSVGTRVTNAGYRWSMVGENIAWGQATAEAVMKDWMNSSGHKANILNCKYRNIGVGLAYSSAKRPYWTQDFGTLM